jgi:hypothetical protein
LEKHTSWNFSPEDGGIIPSKRNYLKKCTNIFLRYSTPGTVRAFLFSAELSKQPPIQSEPGAVSPMIWKKRREAGYSHLTARLLMYRAMILLSYLPS